MTQDIIEKYVYKYSREDYRDMDRDSVFDACAFDVLTHCGPVGDALALAEAIDKDLAENPRPVVNVTHIRSSWYKLHGGDVPLCSGMERVKMRTELGLPEHEFRVPCLATCPECLRIHEKRNSR